MRIELEVMGKQLHFVGINASSAAANQADLARVTSFPLFQDVPEVDAWGLHGAGKDDFLLFDAQGKLVKHLPAFGGLNVDLSTPDGYKNVKDAILAIP